MYDTYVTVVGNVLHPPEWRRTTHTNTLVTTFKIASTARRWDRESGSWVDGNSLRVRVNCWRTLASNVAASVKVGDPLIVTGRLYTREWRDEQGNKRLQYELEAISVGHDLSRGRGRFERVRRSTSTSEIVDGPEHRLGGEPTVPVPPEQAPARFDDAPEPSGGPGAESGPSPGRGVEPDQGRSAPAPVAPTRDLGELTTASVR